jgi:hypothetical protein
MDTGSASTFLSFLSDLQNLLMSSCTVLTFNSSSLEDRQKAQSVEYNRSEGDTLACSKQAESKPQPLPHFPLLGKGQSTELDHWVQLAYLLRQDG